jgi:hypothetical protein
MSLTFSGTSIFIDGQSVEMPWPVLDAIEQGDKVFVLLDPNSYLLDPNYKVTRRQGTPAIRNLIAITRTGTNLWKAEMPEASDYYYRISSAVPLLAYSFSAYQCEIDPEYGTIRNMEFLK